MWMDGMGWMGWDGMRWDGLGWDGWDGWDGMGSQTHQHKENMFEHVLIDLFQDICKYLRVITDIFR